MVYLIFCCFKSSIAMTTSRLIFEKIFEGGCFSGAQCHPLELIHTYLHLLQAAVHILLTNIL